LPIPSFIARLGAQLIGKQDLYNQLFGSLVVNISKAKNLVSWQPVAIVTQSLLASGSPRISPD
jgi:hypothetical protein